MAHIGQKLALQASRFLGPLLGRLQFRGAFAHQFLQVIAMARDLQFPGLDFTEHFIEGLDEFTHFIGGASRCANGVGFS